ncbi:NCK-interacting protein with SH3 domain-like [Pecten maximus]|uniref:NCK-interacting protein with SH3 domain-like n=1 Tax=Pecten maximus TaxID=6579 RepID=UPI0014585DE9|nr:NCK-interacting protein with SH3 domain-like [Pecten maximus]
MFKALYDYNSSNSKYLSFKTGDQFTIINSSHVDWFLAQNGFGEVGYIPRNYITHEDVAFSEVLESIDRAIQAIHYQTSADKCTNSAHLRQNLQKLTQHRQAVVEEYSKRSAPTSQITHNTRQETSEINSQNKSTRTSSQKTFQSNGDGSDPSSPTSSTDKRSSVRRKAPSPPRLSVTGNTPTGAQPGEIKASECHSEEITTTGAQPGESTTSDVSSYIPEGSKEGILSPGSVAEQGTSDNLGCSEAGVASVQGSLTTSISCLTVDTSPSSPSRQVLSPSKGQRSFPNSPSRQFDSPSVINVSSVPIPSHLGAGLAEEVRRHTGLSHDKSCLAVEVVLSHVGSMIPQVALLMEKVLFTFTENSDMSDEDSGHDSMRLQYLFTELVACKDDSQQRSWALHQDQQIIQGYLEELLSILENAKASVCKRAIAKDSYEVLHNLVQYFQMETRISLRLSLLQVFGALCSLEDVIVSHLLYSVLPLELVSDLRNNHSDVRRLNYVALVLTMVVCTGESFPVSLEDHVNAEFIDFVFNLLEEPPTPDHADQTADSLVNLILAPNLHYHDLSINTIMSVIQGKASLQTFTEKVLVLFNRRDDPVKMFDHQVTSVHSVIKFLTDVFSSTATANLLYTNDAKVLVDILIRQLTDLQPGDQVRSSMLTLVELVVTNSEYSDHKHRQEELLKCLNHIKVEEADTETDKGVTKRIIHILQEL